jgi:hypothetical protein
VRGPALALPDDEHRVEWTVLYKDFEALIDKAMSDFAASEGLEVSIRGRLRLGLPCVMPCQSMHVQVESLFHGCGHTKGRAAFSIFSLYVSI